MEFLSAGDHVKFGFPFAFSFTMLGWGAIDYWDSYVLAGETTNLLSNLKWAYDYILKVCLINGIILKYEK